MIDFETKFAIDLNYLTFMNKQMHKTKRFTHLCKTLPLLIVSKQELSSFLTRLHYRQPQIVLKNVPCKVMLLWF